MRLAVVAAGSLRNLLPEERVVVELLRWFGRNCFLPVRVAIYVYRYHRNTDRSAGQCCHLNNTAIRQ